jgi:hypothetical protein
VLIKIKESVKNSEPKSKIKNKKTIPGKIGSKKKIVKRVKAQKVRVKIKVGKKFFRLFIFS